MARLVIGCLAGSAVVTSAVELRQRKGVTEPANNVSQIGKTWLHSTAMSFPLEQRGRRPPTPPTFSTAKFFHDPNGPPNRDGLRQMGAPLTPNFGLCAMTPLLCKAPFMCHIPPRYEEAMNSQIRIATAEGRPNFREWCRYPELATSIVQHCLLSQHMDISAHIMYDLAKKGDNDEIEASRCFLEGHCADTVVTNQTWASTGEALCDKKYGEAWKDVGHSGDAFAEARRSGAMHPADGIKDPKIAKLMGLVSCAHGSYHCDVHTCKQVYCQREYYVTKYKHLQPDF